MQIFLMHNTIFYIKGLRWAFRMFWAEGVTQLWHDISFVIYDVPDRCGLRDGTMNSRLPTWELVSCEEFGSKNFAPRSYREEALTAARNYRKTMDQISGSQDQVYACETWKYS